VNPTNHTVFSGCGIAGMLNLDPRGTHPDPRDLAAVERMTAAVAHRGPHHHGLTHQPGVIMGHRRLAVTGLGPAGDQPMTRDHLTIVYNGETYNAPALRAELAPHYRFRSATDTEVVLRAWQHWGPDAVSRLDGMFAFAIWDRAQQCLSLVRDRIGIKPLYYHRTRDRLIFASEIQALLASGQLPGRPDLDILTRQLLCSSTLQIDATRTPVTGVRAVPPATCLTLHRDGRTHTTRYWQLPAPAQPARHTARRHADELGALLAGSVTGMLMGDVPVAAFLSGGVDSSAICALAATTRPLTCVTVAYHCDTAESRADQDYSHHVSRHINRQPAARKHPESQHRVRHLLARIPPAPTLDDLDAVCDLAAVGDDPRHPAIWRNYQAVRDLDLRVALNGQGADEILGGYVNRPEFIHHLLDVRHPHRPAHPSLAAARQIPGLTDDVIRFQADAHAEVSTFHAGLPGTPLERAHRLLLHTQLRRVVQFEDFLSMQASVEARFPFLNHHLIEWAFTVPYATHIHAPTHRGKVHLAAAMRPYLPDNVITRPKAVFPVPHPASLHTALAHLVTEHATELHDDPLVTHFFQIPPDPATAPVIQLWALLSLWRWHHKLTNSPPAATGTATSRGRIGTIRIARIRR
jgi:asparagine synthase (glutamine-hydrolysing)